MTRILVVGAGATGGYFGGRLQQAERNVSFLVRPRRAAQLRESGLVVRSPKGDLRLTPRLVLAGRIRETYDLVLLCCKAYGLDEAIEAIAPAVGEQTAILPVLNGMRHYDVLDARFGADRVLGGLCSIAVNLNADGSITHLYPMHVLRYGERSRPCGERVAAMEKLFEDVRIDVKASTNILRALWEKWVMLASLAGMTSLMRASIGDILKCPGGLDLLQQILDECAAIATAHGQPPRPAVLEDTRTLLTTKNAPYTSSMLRNIEAGERTEADHILGDLLGRGHQAGLSTPLLRIAYCHVTAYDHRRAAAGK